ncbi:MAG: DUF445 domain-containing protein [Cytophagales bacterium]|nr:MAG: DUF445 domain-containing protein [Cytophagales bacterium]
MSLEQIEQQTSASLAKQRIKEERIARLNKMKTLALCLLLGMIVLFLAAHFLESKLSWLVYVKAFAEAAIVGALADWFAVVALFKHPMGLPIPHTNIIVGKQQKIAKNLSEFVITNFLPEEKIEREIQKLDLSSKIADWFGEDANAEAATEEILRFIPDLLQTVDAQKINLLVGSKAEQLVTNFDLTKEVAGILTLLAQERKHQELLSSVIDLASGYIAENETWMEQQITDNAPAFMPAFIGKQIAKRIIDTLEKLLSEIRVNPQHAFRYELDSIVTNFIAELGQSESYQQKAADIKRGLLEHKTFKQYTSNVWQEVQNFILQDLQDPDSNIRFQIKTAFLGIANKIKNGEELRGSINQRATKEIIRLYHDNRETIAQHISKTVAEWKDIGYKIELEIGRDLQYIRMNGTLVGGTVGLIMYIVFG